jgi:hypothetical protein
MHGIRTNRRIFAHVALFALALQFILSFGHFHHEQFASAAAAAIAAGAPQASASDDTAPDPDGRADAHDLCAICATISLAASTVLPEHATLPAPAASGLALGFEPLTSRLTSQTPRFFQARAPPAVS